MLQSLAAQTAPALPTFAIPALFASGTAFLGWLLGLVAVMAPSGVLAWRSHSAFGHWTRYFAQWRRRSWMGVAVGSLTLGAGMVLGVGAIPAWQARWAQWFAAAQRSRPQESVAFTWLLQTQTHLAQLLQLGALLLVLTGIAALLVCVRHMWVNVLVRRQPAVASPEWIVLPPETRSLSDRSIP